MAIFSLQVEKHALGGLIKFPETYSEIAPYTTEKDFYNNIHSVVFSVLRESITNGEKIDKVLIAQKAKNLGIHFQDDIDIFEYIDSICYTEITEEATVEAFKELITLRIRREYFELGGKLQTHAKNAKNKSADEIITEGDSIYGSQSSSYVLEDQPVNLFEGISKFVEERGNNPIEEAGFPTHHKEFNRMYGGLRPKNLYAFVARPENGKTTFLSDMAFHTSMLSGFKIKVLYLDTEMETEDMKWRLVSSLTGVGMWYLETGNWRKNPEMVAKVRPQLEKMEKYVFEHLKVGNKTIDQICSLCRRWYYKNVGKDGDAIIVYDYIKMTGEKTSDAHKEYQVIGEKVDKLKKLAEQLNAVCLSSMQLNRTGENFNKKASDIADDSSAISASDRLQWFATFVGAFRRKTLDEIAMDGGLNFGTHKLVKFKGRFQGKDAAGHHDLVKRKFPDGTEKFVSNYLSFTVENFKVTEIGDVNLLIKNQDIHLDKTVDADEDAIL